MSNDFEKENKKFITEINEAKEKEMQRDIVYRQYAAIQFSQYIRMLRKWEKYDLLVEICLYDLLDEFFWEYDRWVMKSTAIKDREYFFNNYERNVKNKIWRENLGFKKYSIGSGIPLDNLLFCIREGHTDINKIQILYEKIDKDVYNLKNYVLDHDEVFKVIKKTLNEFLGIK